MRLHDEFHLNIRAAYTAAAITLIALILILSVSWRNIESVYLLIVIICLSCTLFALGISATVFEFYIRWKDEKDKNAIQSAVDRTFGHVKERD